MEVYSPCCYTCGDVDPHVNLYISISTGIFLKSDTSTFFFFFCVFVCEKTSVYQNLLFKWKQSNNDFKK